jgi:hypothetical protein
MRCQQWHALPYALSDAIIEKLSHSHDYLKAQLNGFHSLPIICKLPDTAQTHFPSPSLTKGVRHREHPLQTKPNQLKPTTIMNK